jgi:hypothetical protein
MVNAAASWAMGAEEGEGRIACGGFQDDVPLSVCSNLGVMEGEAAVAAGPELLLPPAFVPMLLVATLAEARALMGDAALLDERIAKRPTEQSLSVIQ